MVRAARTLALPRPLANALRRDVCRDLGPQDLDNLRPVLIRLADRRKRPDEEDLAIDWQAVALACGVDTGAMRRAGPALQAGLERIWQDTLARARLPAAVRDSLLAVVEDETELPRHVFHGDGSPIADADLDHIRAVLDGCTRSFPWQEGDVMMLDNMLAAHGRDPFTGARKVVVAMADPVRSPDLPADLPAA